MTYHQVPDAAHPTLCRRAGATGCTRPAHEHAMVDGKPVADGHIGLCVPCIREQRRLAGQAVRGTGRHKNLGVR